MIGAVGWRKTYFIVGCMGIIFAFLALLVIRDPERGRFDPKKTEP